MNEILTIVEHQVVNLSEKRDIALSILSYEDFELLFNITYTDKKDKKRFLFSYLARDKIKANSIVGSVSLKNGLTIEILPKFANGELSETLKKRYRETLLNIIRVSKENNFIVTQSQSNKVSMSEMPLINYIIELFSSSLLFTLRQGLYQTYAKEINNTSFIKGNILISKTIQNNFVDKSKMYCSHIKHSSNNLLMSVFKTLSKLLMQDDNLSYKTKQNLHEIYILLDNVDLIDLREQDFKKVVFNRLNDKYEVLFSQAKFIFNKYMPFSSKINATPFWSILFSMDYLFEKFIAYLFQRSNIVFQEQNLIKCFKNEQKDMFVSIKPDFIIESTNNLVSVVDAKWKLLKKDETLYGLNAQNFWQLFSYMNLISQNEQINGYFIVPKNNDSFDDEILFEPINENNKSITIISIDFSLEFNEIVNNFYFEIENKQLKYRERITILEKDIKDDLVDDFSSKFNMEKFINELEVLNKDKNLLKLFSKNRNKYNIEFPNILFLKEFNTANTNTFKQFIKENLKRESLALEGLEINYIPSNIKKLKNLRILNLGFNNIGILPEEFFELKKLEILVLNKNINVILSKKLVELSALRKIIIDKDLVKNNLDVLKYIISKNIIIEDHLNNDNLMNFIQRSGNYSFTDKENVDLCYLNDKDILFTLASDKNTDDEVKIILFYKIYEDYELKNTIHNILLSNSSVKLKELFERSIENIVTILETNYDFINKNHQSWLYGFVNCDNNSAIYAIKMIIAKKTNSIDIISKLILEKNETKILYSLLENLNQDNKKYLISTDILERILNYAIEQSNIKIVLKILNRTEITLELVKNIVVNFENIIVINKLINVDYNNKEIQEWVNDKYPIPQVSINLENYSNTSTYDKETFVIEANLKLYESELIKNFCYENNENILEEIVYNKTLPLKFLFLIYILNFRNIEFKKNNLFNLFSNMENEYINEIIKLTENNGIYALTEYIKENFYDIHDEILFAYAMSNTKEVYYIREIICELTNDLNIIDELSKNRNDEGILRKILYKQRNNKKFQEIVKSYNSTYTTNILNRISKYDEYFEDNNKYCLITQIALSWKLSLETRNYLFNKYNNDVELLRALDSSTSTSYNQKIKSFNNKVARRITYLEEDSHNLYNKIVFNNE